MKKPQKGLLKWAGGKEREIATLKLNFPKTIERYFEPFVGGGSVYLNTPASQYFINDSYDELAQFYTSILSNDKRVKFYLLLIDKLWLITTDIFSKYSQALTDYLRKTTEDKDKNKTLALISEDFLNIFNQDGFRDFLHERIDFKKDFEKNIENKIQRIIKHEQAKGVLNDIDLQNNLKTALKSAIYIHIRTIYNLYRKEGKINSPFFVACFFFIRNYCYSSMFRYNSNNEFNVPYGGASYNENYLYKKIEYLYSSFNQEKYKQTTVKNLDFQKFLEEYNYSKHDFIFLDPPYDSEFSDYAGNSFSKQDQIRLATFLTATNAKFLLVIKRTDFIESLYTDDKFNIKVFEKTYQVSFKNRNNRNAEHLVITNF